MSGDAMHMDAPEYFQAQLARVFENYINLKEAFVASDAERTARAAEAVTTSIDKVDEGMLDENGQQLWEKQRQAMKKALEQISGSTEIGEQRTAFAGLSETLYQSIKAFGVKGMSGYYQYCPMAMDNTGAHWLSNSKEIRNPYFGDRMMKCGKTVKTF